MSGMKKPPPAKRQLKKTYSTVLLERRHKQQPSGIKVQITDLLDHYCNLSIDSRPDEELQLVRFTGIIATIGPASKDISMLKQLIQSGLNIARLNFSHGSHEYHAETIANVRQAVQELADEGEVDYNIAIALDTKGPEIRTGLVHGSATGEVQLVTGEPITVSIKEEDKENCSSTLIYVDYQNLPKVIKKDGVIYIDDGLISLRINEIGSDTVECTVENGGALGSRKGVNLPEAEVDLPAVSEKDKLDLLFGIEQGVDMIFASFIRKASDVGQMRSILGPAGAKIKIISKVENHEGVRRFDEILEASDGIMCARGDLGIEIPPEKVFLAQKMMIGKCNKAGKPVICATQMLESMVKNPRPTRAETSDVANAVLDGADCIMLSGETAKGAYPLETLRIMHKIALEAEAAVFHDSMFDALRKATVMPCSSPATIAIGAVEASYKSAAGAILVLTMSGKSAGLLAAYRPRCPVIAVTRDPQVARQLHLHRGIFPLLYKIPIGDTDWQTDSGNRIQFGLNKAKARKHIQDTDTVVCVTGWRQGAGFTNTMRIRSANTDLLEEE